MKIPLKSMLTAGVVATGLAAPALADSGRVTVEDVVPDTLVVKSNGQSYTVLANNGMTNVQMHVMYEVGAAGRVKSWKAWPVINTGTGPSQGIGDLKPYAVSKSYALGDRPKVVDRWVSSSVPAHLYEAKAVQMCNLLASALRQEGRSNKQIFGQHQYVKFAAHADYEFDVSGAGSNNALFEVSWPHDVKVRCARWEGTQIPQASNDIANPLHVRKATLQLQERALMNGMCAVKLTTAISTNTAGATIKYRYEHSSGKKSEVFSAKTAGNGIAVVTHTWDVPNKHGDEIGWMRMQGVGIDFASNKAGYQMSCRNAPGGLKVKTDPTPIPQGSKDLANKLQVWNAHLQAGEVSAANGTCKLKLNAEIQTNAANATLSYRYVHSSGQKSPVQSVKTGGDKVARFAKTWEIPNGTGPETGWMQVVGAGASFQSNKASYYMKCVDAPKGLAKTVRKPSKRKVRIKLGGRGRLSN